jgi:hypothetical protein
MFPPELGTGYLLMASPLDPKWGVFRCGREVPLSKHITAIPDDLRSALWSAEQYPPALALARDAISGEFSERQLDRNRFFERYRDLLVDYMSRQPSAPYILVRAVGDELGYLTRGQFYWVLRYLKDSNTVQWVSADYFVYQNRASDFALSQEQLAALELRPRRLTKR